MPQRHTLRIYLDEIPLRRAEKGNFNLINRIRSAFLSCGYTTELRLNSHAERLKSAKFGGYSLFHMDDPFHPRALTLRRAYYYPFWRIEKSAKRWEWEIAGQPFEPDAIDPDQAKKFCDFWRGKLFKSAQSPPKRRGLVYVPLQGRLLEQRSFQVLSPVEMIKAVLKYDPDRNVCVGFHPGERYSSQERNAIQQLASNFPRLSVSNESMEILLGQCDYVATENSSVALAGYFFHKPAAIFAQIDFHHIAADAAANGAAAAVSAAPGLRPDFDRYLFWFLKITTINAGSAEAETQILDMVRRRGWMV